MIAIWLLAMFIGGFCAGWAIRSYLHGGREPLAASDRDQDRARFTSTRCTCYYVNGGDVVRDARCPAHTAWSFCPRCSRTDGTHTTACDRARLDGVVASMYRGKNWRDG